MQKSLHIKNIISFAACAAVMLSLSACGNGNDNVMFGVLNQLSASQESAEAAKTSTAAETEAAQNEASAATAEPTDEAGGNPDDSNSLTIEITVLEDKYIYDNREISYDELLEVFDTLTEADMVQFRDENAALDTYRKATSALDERNIPYINYTDQ